jgi:hypothetical protein
MNKLEQVLVAIGRWRAPAPYAMFRSKHEQRLAFRSRGMRNVLCALAAVVPLVHLAASLA